MKVLTRSGHQEEVNFNLVKERLVNLANRFNLLNVNPDKLAQDTISHMYDGISTSELDTHAAKISASLGSLHPDYMKFAAIIAVDNLHKETSDNIIEVIDNIGNLSDKYSQIIRKYSNELQSIIKYDRDFNYGYMVFLTLVQSYLLKDYQGKIIERPQHLHLRVATWLSGDNLPAIIDTYNSLSTGEYTHATPTNFNSGTINSQLASCFLLGIEDSIQGIYKTISDCALISKGAGGIGVHIHNIRASGTGIKSTNGISNGIIPMIKVFNETARYVDQCLVPESIIYTQNGLKKISDLSLSDQVITLDGKFLPIKKILEHNYSGTMYYVKTKYFPEISLTGQHPIYSIKGKNMSLLQLSKKLTYRTERPDFIEAENLNEDDFVGIQIPTYEIDYQQYKEDDCYFYGIFLSKGKYDKKYSFDNLDEEEEKFIKSYFEKKCIYYVNNEWDSNTNLVFTNKQLTSNIINNDILHLPLNKVRAVLKGINLKSKFNSEIINQIKYLYLRFGIIVDEKNGEFIPLTDITYKPTNNRYVINNDNILWTRITNITKGQYNGLVYDLEVDTNNLNKHNYLTDSVLVHNGGGKRKGSIAIYLEPWHSDILDFLELKKNSGEETKKARDIFLALWIPDLFMERVRDDKMWSLMCPHKCPGLSLVYGDQFKELYESYENENKHNSQIKARELFKKIMESQIETGVPYMCYKDAGNKKSNQKNIGVIQSSNLCSEIFQYSDNKEYSVCNLASLNLSKFVESDGSYNFERLKQVAYKATINLDKVIDITEYPTPETRKSNLAHRPIGLGVQGLADVFYKMKYSFDSPDAQKLNLQIFETIYYGAISASADLAQEKGCYPTFEGSDFNKGLLQFKRF
jgi:hypothetical protein